MDDEDKIVSHVRYYLEGRQKWQNEDNQLLTQANYTPPTLMVKPTWNNAGALCWNLELYDMLVLIHAHNDRQT